MMFDTILFFNILGLLLSVSSAAIITSAASSMTGRFRFGLMSFMWGIGFIGLSFLWSVIELYYVVGISHLQTVFLSVGMTLIMIASWNLFTYDVS